MKAKSYSIFASEKSISGCYCLMTLKKITYTFHERFQRFHPLILINLRLVLFILYVMDRMGGTTIILSTWGLKLSSKSDTLMGWGSILVVLISISPSTKYFHQVWSAFLSSSMRTTRQPWSLSIVQTEFSALIRWYNDPYNQPRKK